MLLIAGILFVGICVTVIFSASMWRQFSREEQTTRAGVKQDLRETLQSRDEAERRLIGKLCEGRDTRVSIEQWQGELEEAHGGKWRQTESDLKKQSEAEFGSRIQSVRNRTLFRMAVGVVLIVLVFGGTSGVAYHYVSERENHLAATSPDAPSAFGLQDTDALDSEFPGFSDEDFETLTPDGFGDDSQSGSGLSDDDSAAANPDEEQVD